jgi:hypothetical protein
MLAHDPWAMMGAAAVGVVGAATAEFIARSRVMRRQVALTELTPAPALNG